MVFIAVGGSIVADESDSDHQHEAVSKQDDMLTYRVSVIVVELNEQHEFGSVMSHDDMKSIIADEGLNTLLSHLKQFGKVDLRMKDETKRLSSENAKIFSGSEQPFISTIENSDDNAVRSIRQSSVSTGTSIEFKPIKDEQGKIVSVEQSIDSDIAFLTNQNDQMLIGRVRYSSDQSLSVLQSGSITIKSTIQNVHDKRLEIFFITEIV